MKKIILLCLCGSALFSCKENSDKPADNTYPVLEVALSDVTLLSQYSAVVEGRQHVEIRPQVSGLITKICINEGAAVKKGQLLFVIDQTSYQAALETAVANVTSAKSRLATAELTAESKRELYAAAVVSEYDYQTAQNDLQEARANLMQAKAEELNARNSLSYTEIKSPVDGVTSMIPYRIGTLVSPSITEPLVTVSDDKEIYAYFSMTENQILDLMCEYGSLDKTMSNMPAVQLKLSNGQLYEAEGRIDAMSGTIESQTGVVRVRALFPNPKRILRNGGSGSLVIPYRKKDCIVIPQGATFEIQDRTYVYKVVDGKTVSTAVTTFKIDNGTQYVVESGLKPGDKIIAEGAGLLREGVSVKMELPNN